MLLHRQERQKLRIRSPERMPDKRIQPNEVQKLRRSVWRASAGALVLGARKCRDLRLSKVRGVMAREFKLIYSEVSIAGGAGHSGRSKARFSRGSAVSNSHFTFTHTPTGVKVSGRVIPGHYSRRELSRLNQKLCEEMHKRLEYEVAKTLRAPGRKAITPSGDPDHGIVISYV